jgi:hypothetical protein
MMASPLLFTKILYKSHGWSSLSSLI